ncbi:MAG: NADH-quinone oxidoreductase subunit E [Bdellovibrionaceae bacterium]|nr:NADH-quinone oxidoreductase subunit E [Pseudobdellovibrionaceae bacterium]
MFQLSPAGIDFVKTELNRYETKRSAILPCLYKVQEENGGWVSPEAVNHLADVMDIPAAHINEVLYFYTMYNKKPVGRLHVQVCATISCAMNGARELAKHICDKYQVKEGEISDDGMVTVTKVECLGSCGTAPMMQIGNAYYENLTKESAIEVIEDLKKKSTNQ